MNVNTDLVDTLADACCSLHNFLRERSPQNYTSPETMDQENILDFTVSLSDRCNPQLLYNLQRGPRGNILNSAKEAKNGFAQYFKNEGSVNWQHEFIT